MMEAREHRPNLRRDREISVAMPMQVELRLLLEIFEIRHRARCRLSRRALPVRPEGSVAPYSTEHFVNVPGMNVKINFPFGICIGIRGERSARQEKRIGFWHD